ncbi:MAG: 3'-5' exonuclease [Dehalococcoidia bacterium]
MTSNKTTLGEMLMENAKKNAAMVKGEDYECTPDPATEPSYANLILFYDTETSGFRSGKKHYDDPSQAWVVQLAWILARDEEVVSSGNHIICGDGKADINYRAQEVHGISMEKSLEVGVPEGYVTDLFLRDFTKAASVCCHHYKFDIEFLKDMIARNVDVETAVSFGKTPHLCTMDSSTEFCKLPHGRWKNRFKFPKLTELHQILFSEDFANAHDAMGDVKATMRCYYELVKRGVMS